MKKEIIKIGLLVLVIYSNIAVVSLGDDKKPVDEGKEILRGGEAGENNITVEETNTTIVLKFAIVEHLPITLTIERNGEVVLEEVNENEEEIGFEIAKETLQVGDTIIIRNRFEEVARIEISKE
ncbi:MAG: hypothetical protein KU38_00630 [Sulfurovum sp. FS08-3]|nr:MAG: hypothetical protein KU38_00630 [Sulfurovum sp. FS08-3]